MTRKIKCPFCGSPVHLQEAKIIDKRLKNKLAYICSNDNCKAYALANNEEKMVGTMANEELLKMRKNVNSKIDELIKQKNDKFPDRQKTNLWISKNLYIKQLPDKKLSNFSKIMCKQAIRLCNRELNS